MQARINAWRKVRTLAPTEVPNEFATSFAPIPNARMKAMMNPTTNIHIWSCWKLTSPNISKWTPGHCAQLWMLFEFLKPTYSLLPAREQIFAQYQLRIKQPWRFLWNSEVIFSVSRVAVNLLTQTWWIFYCHHSTCNNTYYKYQQNQQWLNVSSQITLYHVASNLQ